MTAISRDAGAGRFPGDPGRWTTRAGRRTNGLGGEVAIVTGASSGIGAATAHALAARGARVVLAARRTERLQAAQEAISGSGGSAVAVATDVSDPTQLSKLVDRAHEEFGCVDILVNNAGVNWRRPLASSACDDVREVLEVNLLGAVVLTRLVLPGMLERGHGSIISVGSLSGRVAMEPIYSASKYGLRGFSLALRRQLAGTGVAVSLVSPANIRSDMTSHVDGRLPEPTVVADTICGLVARPCREVVVPSRHYVIAWLEELLPGCADVAHRWRHWSPLEG
jgi:NADP-dependent 3-hydroxy acid dehydrogenase YdfG